MPFKIGPAPIRRTLKYLNAGRLIFKDRVKIVSINFNREGDHHRGTKDFVFWTLPQIEYKNPNIQFVILRNFTPSPFIRCFLDDGEEVLVDTDSKDRFQIHDHLKRILGKSDETLALEAKATQQVTNPANFGAEYDRHCICEVPGQVPCPSVIKLPNHLRGKYRFGRAEDA